MKSNLKLNTLAGGALQEHFERELETVLENIHDINTSPKKARTITMTLKLTTNDARDIIGVDVAAKSTLVPVDATEFNMVTGKNERGTIEVKELRSGAKGQTFVDDDGEQKHDDGTPVEEVKNTKVHSMYK